MSQLSNSFKMSKKLGNISSKDIIGEGEKEEESGKDVDDNDSNPTPEISDFFIIKNLICIGIAFVINFTAANALGILQSSINSEEGIGTASLSVLYAGMIISCMFVPSFVIKHFGCKWTMAVTLIGYAVMIAANFKPTWATMMPTAVIEGLCAAPLWSAKCVYINQISRIYAVRHDMSVEAATNAFFGVFFTMFQSTQIWGNLLSSKLLQQTAQGSETFFSDRLAICGAEYCNQDLDSFSKLSVNVSSNSTESLPPHKQDDSLRLLIGIYLGMSLFSSLFVIVCVNDLPKSVSEFGQSKMSTIRLIVATFAMLRKKVQLLLIPLTIFRGMEESFFSADFTKAFVTCTMGVQNVGYVAICYGVVASIFALTFGFSIKVVGRLPIFLLAACINFSAIAVMLIVHPSPNKVIVIYIIASLWAMGDACWQSQISALYGVLFFDDMEAAFSSFRLFDSIGFIMGFSWSNFICIESKLWILFGFLCTGLIGYLTVETQSRYSSRKTVSISNPKLPSSQVDLIAYRSSAMICQDPDACEL